jgi:hypothetical protein
MKTTIFCALLLSLCLTTAHAAGKDTVLLTKAADLGKLNFSQDIRKDLLQLTDGICAGTNSVALVSYEVRHWERVGPIDFDPSWALLRSYAVADPDCANSKSKEALVKAATDSARKQFNNDLRRRTTKINEGICGGDAPTYLVNYEFADVRLSGKPTTWTTIKSYGTPKAELVLEDGPLLMDFETCAE